jgi:hypothetical protein
MKKILCLSIFLFLPTISHAQAQTQHATTGMNANTATTSGGAGGGFAIGGTASVTPAIVRTHGPINGVTAYHNPGSFELTEVLPWKQAVELGQPKPQKDLATVARETREQKAKENTPAHVTITN